MRRRWLLLLLVCLPVVVLIGGSIWAAPAAQDLLLENFIFDTRADLEILADEVYGIGSRPETWTFSTDAAAPTAASDLWFDSEQVANTVYGIDTRPPEWFGATVAAPRILSRNVRHDIEIAADEVFGGATRPVEWRGAAPIVRCDRTLQNTVDLLAQYGVTLTTPESVLDYCAAVAAEIEDDLVNIVFADQAGASFNDLLLTVRGDLERLADENLGLDNRPAGYIRNTDANSPTLASDIYLDMQTLADELLGANNRPVGWIGSIGNNAAVNYVNLRHDVELLADETLGFNERPNGWQGGDPLLRCDPQIQNLTFLARDVYNFNIPPEIDPNAPGFCAQLEGAVNQLVESPPVEDIVSEEEINERFLGESNYAFAYLDPAATQYMGIMPGGTQFRAWYRNYAESTMMFVSSDDFAVYVSYEFTTIPLEVFDSLPTIENRNILTFCDASWCNGPGPTPTPTGFGPLFEVLQQATPPAQPTPEDIPGGGGIGTKVQVSWNNIRVTYFQDNAETRTAQVGMEICQEAAQVATACESVIRVQDANGGTVTPVAQINGLNVYEFEYGYTSGILIEGETLYSTDVWISDPTIR